jgi:endonuclease-3 related protein
MAASKNAIRTVYKALLGAYGPQGWWPLPACTGRGFDGHGYHAGSYDLPRTPAQRFQIIMGAVLTQNTAWSNAEKALKGLFREGIRSARRLMECPMPRLAQLIRSSGCYTQKARKIAGLAPVLLDPGFLSAVRMPTRERLLSLWGIGPETADSILLYAFKLPFFVVDSYTRRLFARLRIISAGGRYSEIQRLFHDTLPSDHALFNEYHALIVEHSKRYCRARPRCDGCPLKFCPSRFAL